MDLRFAGWRVLAKIIVPELMDCELAGGELNVR